VLSYLNRLPVVAVLVELASSASPATPDFRESDKDFILRFGKSVSLTEKRLEHILKRPEMSGQLERIEETLANPDIIRESNHDSMVWLFYRFYTVTPVTEKYLLVVVRLFDDSRSIITAFIRTRLRKVHRYGKNEYLV